MREPNVIMTLCRRASLVIWSASQCSYYTRAHTKPHATAQMKGLHVMSVEASVVPSLTQISDEDKGVFGCNQRAFHIHSQPLLSCATATLLLISIYLNLSLSPSLPLHPSLAHVSVFVVQPVAQTLSYARRRRHGGRRSRMIHVH